jgi:hypothetical protein
LSSLLATHMCPAATPAPLTLTPPFTHLPLLQSYPHQLKAAEEALQRAEQHKARLLALQPLWLRLQDLQEKQLPPLREQVGRESGCVVPGW